jgi:hypothetical protein
MGLPTERECCASYRREDGDPIELFYNAASLPPFSTTA